MPQGLEIYRDGVFEAGGLPYFDTYGGFILGSAAFTAGSAGNVTDANFANGNPFWFIDGVFAPGLPVFSIAGTTLSWTAGGIGGTVYYGIC